MLDRETIELALFLAGAECSGTLLERQESTHCGSRKRANQFTDLPPLPRYKRMPTILPAQDLQNRIGISLVIGELNQLGKLDLALADRVPPPKLEEFLCGDALRDARTKRNARAAHKRSVFRWNADELNRLQDFRDKVLIG